MNSILINVSLRYSESEVLDSDNDNKDLLDEDFMEDNETYESNFECLLPNHHS